MRKALVIGHQSNNQGAYGSEGIGEWEFNRELLEDTIQRMEDDYKIYDECKIFMRDKNIHGYTNQMKELHERIDAWHADVSIEFHFNSFSSDSAHGHEVLYCSNGGEVEAMDLNQCLDKHLPTSNRGVKKVTMDDRGGGFCCRGSSYALIIEPFFGAHQYKFIEDGSLRQPLISAITEYLRVEA